MSSKASAELAGQILGWYSTPVGVAPVVNDLATGDDLGASISLLQTGVSYAEMIGTKLSNPVTLGLPLAALGVDTFKLTSVPTLPKSSNVTN